MILQPRSTDNLAQGVIAKMAKSYRLISGDAVEVNRQLTVLSAENREGSPHAPQKPILMSSVIATDASGRAFATLYVIIEVES